MPKERRCRSAARLPGAAPTLVSSVDRVPASATSQGSQRGSCPVASCQPRFRGISIANSDISWGFFLIFLI